MFNAVRSAHSATAGLLVSVCRTSVNNPAEWCHCYSQSLTSFSIDPFWFLRLTATVRTDTCLGHWHCSDSGQWDDIANG